MSRPLTSQQSTPASIGCGTRRRNSRRCCSAQPVHGSALLVGHKKATPVPSPLRSKPLPYKMSSAGSTMPVIYLMVSENRCILPQMGRLGRLTRRKTRADGGPFRALPLWLAEWETPSLAAVPLVSRHKSKVVNASLAARQLGIKAGSSLATALSKAPDHGQRLRLPRA